MRSFVVALVAAGLLFQTTFGFAAIDQKVVGRAPVTVNQSVKVLTPGNRAQGTLSRVDKASKTLELQTAQGLVRVPVKGRLQLQHGLNGTPVNSSFGEVQALSRRIIIIVIVTGTVVVIIIIRSAK